MTDFTSDIFHIVSKIPRGKVATYGQIAMLAGDFRMSRAVGNALHQNTDPISVPCHRVVNAKGYLAKHFGMGGAKVQKERLEAEGVVVSEENQVDLAEYGWDNKVRYYSLNHYLRDAYAGKVYKLAIDAGFTCPNRDGRIDTRGCIFCSAGGSGDFAQNRNLAIATQIAQAKNLVERKMGANPKGYIAYFQAYTNTYAPLAELEWKYRAALDCQEVLAISIATRPDCLDAAIVTLLSRLKAEYGKDIWVELGLQTIHEKTARYIRRGYSLSSYEDAMTMLQAAGLRVVTHVILGLPGETKKDMLNTVGYVGRSGSWGIKLQLLHVLANTDLAIDYQKGIVRTLEEEEYCLLIRECLARLPYDMVIHRITGDGDKKTLIAPLWSGNKRHVVNRFHELLLDE